MFSRLKNLLQLSFPFEPFIFLRINLIGCEGLCKKPSHVCDAGEKWNNSHSCQMTHLLQGTEDHGDLFCVKESLRHQRQTGLCIPLQFIVTVVILDRSDLEQRTEIGEREDRRHIKSLCGVYTLSIIILKLVVTKLADQSQELMSECFTLKSRGSNRSCSGTAVEKERPALAISHFSTADI